jgi:CheY-like chemotaxis protein
MAVPRKIGIVDDSVTIRTAFQLTFAGEDLGVEAHGFASADDALKSADKLDLLYVDTKLGAEDGYHACARLRGTPTFASTPIVLLFGPWETYDEARGRASGAVGGIQKPWDSEDMIVKAPRSSPAHRPRRRSRPRLRHSPPLRGLPCRRPRRSLVRFRPASRFRRLRRSGSRPRSRFRAVPDRLP